MEEVGEEEAEEEEEGEESTEVVTVLLLLLDLKSLCIKNLRSELFKLLILALLLEGQRLL